MPSDWSSDVCSRSEEHTSELQSHDNLVCRLLLEKTHYSSSSPFSSLPPLPHSPPTSLRAAPPAPRARRLGLSPSLLFLSFLPSPHFFFWPVLPPHFHLFPPPRCCRV